MAAEAKQRLQAAAASDDPAVKLGALEGAKGVIREVRAERDRDFADLGAAHELQRGALFGRDGLYDKYVAPLDGQVRQDKAARAELTNLGFSVSASARDLVDARRPMLQAASDYHRFRASPEGWDTQVIAPLEQKLSYLSGARGRSADGERLRQAITASFPWPVDTSTAGGARLDALLKQVTALGERYDLLQNARELPALQPSQPSRLLNYATARERTLESQGGGDLAGLDAVAELKRQANAVEADVRATNALAGAALERDAAVYRAGGEAGLLEAGVVTDASMRDAAVDAVRTQLGETRTELVALLRSLGPSAMGKPDGALGELVALPPAELQGKLDALDKLDRVDWLGFASEDPQAPES